MPDGNLHHLHKYAYLEIERRFLVRTLPANLTHDNFLRIVDHYVSGTRLRLRRMEAPSGEARVYKLGQKYRAPQQPAHHALMTTMYLTAYEYQRLLSLGGASLVKRRYPWRYAGQQFGIDVFEGRLSGLILLEVEGREGVDISTLSMPSIAEREVTAEPFFNGGALAQMTQADFQAWLSHWQQDAGAG